jgi:hypothetical protein
MQNLLGLFTTHHDIPFSYFRDHNWNIFAEHIPMEKKNGTHPLKNLDIRKAITEQYIQVRSKIHFVVDSSDSLERNTLYLHEH